MQLRRFLAGGPHDKKQVPWEQYDYAAYAYRFGWTPEQVDRIPMRVKAWLWPITEALDAENEKRQKRAAEDEERRQKKFSRRH